MKEVLLDFDEFMNRIDGPRSKVHGEAMTTAEYNIDHKDELLLMDLRASLQADIARAMAELIQCKEVISNTKLGVNPYLHDAYCEVGTRLQDMITNWYKWFPG